MKYIIVFFLLVTLKSNSFSQDRTYRPKRIAFLRTDTCITKGAVSCDSLMVRREREVIQKMTSEMKKEIDVGRSTSGADSSLANEVLDFFKAALEEIPMKQADLEITIDSNGDLIKRYYRPETSMKNSFEMIEENGKIYYYHSLKDTSILYNTYDVFAMKRDYEISVDKSDKRVILGIECYKMIITEKEIIESDFPFELGDKVYEMYVTNTINLPLHALIYISKQFPGFFPLEIKQWYTKNPESVTMFNVKQIVK